MKLARHILALCLISTFAGAATAKEVVTEADIIYAEDQTLPHGLVLLPGSLVIKNPSQSGTPYSENSFAIKIPSTSGHRGYWAGEYAKQLENLGWASTKIPDMMQMLNRMEDGCREQMFVIELGPNMSELLRANSTGDFEFEIDLIAFNYTKNGDCKD